MRRARWKRRHRQVGRKPNPAAAAANGREGQRTDASCVARARARARLRRGLFPAALAQARTIVERGGLRRLRLRRALPQQLRTLAPAAAAAAVAAAACAAVFSCARIAAAGGPRLRVRLRVRLHLRGCLCVRVHLRLRVRVRRVLRGDVRAEVVGAAELDGAVRADVAPLARVDRHVAPQVGAEGEGLAAG